MTRLDPEALQQHIGRLPPLADDPAYLVFADWLQAQGHPWGELIVLQHRAATATGDERAGFEREAASLLEARGAEILGEEVPRERAELVWHLGFVRRARLRTPAEATAIWMAARALLEAPCARMLEGLILDPRPETFTTMRDWDQSSENIEDPWPEWDDLSPLLHERVPHVGFGGWPASAASAYVRMPSFEALSRYLRTTLRRLELTGTPYRPAESLDLPALVELDVRYADAEDEDLDAIAESKLPALERLGLTLGGSSNCILDDVYAPEEYDEDNEGQERYPPRYTADDLESLGVHGVNTNVSDRALRRLLDALPPRVTDLGLTSSQLTGELLNVLVRHPRVAGLRRLDLSGCALGDDAAAILLDGAEALVRIGAIDLSRNRMTERYSSRLTRALPRVTLGEQGGSEPDFFMRYVATME